MQRGDIGAVSEYSWSPNGERLTLAHGDGRLSVVDDWSLKGFVLSPFFFGPRLLGSVGGVSLDFLAAKGVAELR